MSGDHQTHIVQVPPGRWRVTSITQTSGFDYAVYITDFCLGAPSFEVRAGEAVYAGSFTQRGAFGPDMDLTAAQADLAEVPAIASRLRAASYINGATYPCGGTYIYALEVPGAPFSEDYAYGSNYGAQPEALVVSDPIIEQPSAEQPSTP
ncbi:MAG: hypothetical protein NT015_04930 [Alphaproteobacteria bacterium]|nr:hypothetical protein [Alphaproteobacteria bacterium]